MSQDNSPSRFFFIAGQPALDFVNTRPVLNGAVVDLIASVEDLAAWLEAAKLSDAAMGRRARGLSGTRAGQELLAEAIELREALREILERHTSGRPSSEPALARINELLRRLPQHAQIVRARRGFEAKMVSEADEARQLLAPIAAAASELLCERDLTRVKRCNHPACVLFFYDTTKSRTRRWCSMEVCGNRLKAAAHYERQRRARRRSSGS